MSTSLVSIMAAVKLKYIALRVYIHPRKGLAEENSIYSSPLVSVEEFVPGLPQTPKPAGAPVSCIKWHNVYIHPTHVFPVLL